MKKALVLLLSLGIVLGVAGAANAFFWKIGTASYESNNDGTYNTYNKPYKAIYVDGNRVHKLVEKPVQKQMDKKVDYNKAFPF
jgi:nicotinic acid phosphoribosyltransferase